MGRTKRKYRHSKEIYASWKYGYYWRILELKISSWIFSSRGVAVNSGSNY